MQIAGEAVWKGKAQRWKDPSDRSKGLEPFEPGGSQRNIAAGPAPRQINGDPATAGLVRSLQQELSRVVDDAPVEHEEIAEVVGPYLSVVTQRKCSAAFASSRGDRRASTTFSAKALKNAVRKFSAVQIEGQGFFVTLTYPRVWEDNPAKWKTDLDNFRQWLTRRFPRLCILWRLEFQVRGAPHYHLVCWNCDGLPLLYTAGDLGRKWAGFVGSDDPAFLDRGVHLEYLKSKDKASTYLLKEFSKTSQVIRGRVGRYWGMFGRRFMKNASVLLLALSLNQAEVLRDFLSEHNRINQGIEASEWDAWRARRWGIVEDPGGVLRDIIEVSAPF